MAIATGTAILGAAVIGAGASMAAGSAQADAAESAGELSYMAQLEAIAEQRRQYDQSRADLAPYRETGTNALAQYAALYGMSKEGVISPEEMEAARSMFTETPGYDFRFGEGLKALDRSASARGRLDSGAHSKDLLRFGQGIATDEFATYSNALRDLTGIGQSATGQQVAVNTNTGNAIAGLTMGGAQMRGNAMTDAATARASGYAGVGNAASGAVSNFLMHKYLNPQTTI